MNKELKLNSKEVNKLINELYEASVKYYQTNEDSGLTDEDFDQKLSFLKEIYQTGDYKDLFAHDTKGLSLVEEKVALGTSVTKDDEEYRHKAPMLSLDKANKKEQLESFLKRVNAAGETDFRLQAKFDGLALSVHYYNGEIKVIATRGDGEVGSNSTYVLEDSNITIKGLPREINIKDHLEVRGELMFTDEQFKKADDNRFKITGQRFKNSRNSASGLLKKSKAGVGYPIELTFVTYSVLENGKLTYLSKASEEEGFLSADDLTLKYAPNIKLSNFSNNDELFKSINEFGELRESLSIPTDGVVIKPKDEVLLHEKMGVTTSHPASQIAWKYPSETAETIIESIDITVGKTGRLTPIARIKPVILDGSEISNASLHNFNLITVKEVRVGSVISIEKAGEIIPQIKSVIHNSEDTVEIETPTDCPSCRSKLVGEITSDNLPPKTLKCQNINCPSREFYALLTAVGKNYLDIDGLSEVTLKHFNELGRIKDISDLYTLTEEELANSINGYTLKGTARRLGEKRAQHILKYIEKSKTKPLTKVLPALNIDLLGRTATKKLEESFKNLDSILEATEDQISNIDGLGEVSSQKIFEGLQLRKPLITKLKSIGVTFGEKNKKESNENTSVSGLSFAISGSVPEPFANRSLWVDYIEENNGSFHSSPKKDTDYIIGDKDDTSSKIKKANQLGLKFLTPEEFTQMFT